MSNRPRMENGKNDKSSLASFCSETRKSRTGRGFAGLAGHGFSAQLGFNEQKRAQEAQKRGTNRFLKTPGGTTTRSERESPATLSVAAVRSFSSFFRATVRRFAIGYSPALRVRPIAQALFCQRPSSASCHGRGRVPKCGPRFQRGSADPV